MCQKVKVSCEICRCRIGLFPIVSDHTIKLPKQYFMQIIFSFQASQSRWTASLQRWVNPILQHLPVASLRYVSLGKSSFQVFLPSHYLSDLCCLHELWWFGMALKLNCVCNDTVMIWVWWWSDSLHFFMIAETHS